MINNFMCRSVWDVLDRVEAASRKMMTAYDWNLVYRSVSMPIGFEGVTGQAWENIFEAINDEDLA